MISLESNATNYTYSNQEQSAADKQEDSDCENEDEGHSNDCENATAELFVRLTDMVRKHYCGYLEKQLMENVQIWRENKTQIEENAATDLQPREKAALQECCRVLEDRALKACMHARRYQRSMLKIIAEVRRSTQEFRLDDQLRKLITADEESKTSNQSARKQKATQTNESMCFINNSPRRLTTEDDINIKNSPCSLSLQQKIELFQERLNQEAALKVAVKHKECYRRASRHSLHKPFTDKLQMHHHRNHSRRTFDHHNKIPRCIELYEKDGETTSPPSTAPVTIQQDATIEIPNQIAAPSISADSVNKPLSTAAANCEQFSTAENDLLEQDDEIAKELAQLFSEEKSDLEELLGLHSNPEIDDPQVRSVFEEIENAPLSHETSETLKQSTQRMDCSPEKQQRYTSPTKLNGLPQISVSPFENFLDPTSSQHHHLSSGHSERPVANLRHSLWPCELYMQRRRLTASLSRLIEEDFRWHDLIQWKFHTLFGEDSDDEFATCSPSIELDEVLICSCIKRISPWMVNHLMKPMRDGLIANRFLFKKLAKRLAHSIVLENQYPDERFIKRAVEEYFCLHQAVVSLEDMADMPNLNTINDIV